ncbi:MAG: GMC family oxidoreductase N-terminal domain-containing protein, partial [Pseudomonadota bacterium]
MERTPTRESPNGTWAINGRATTFLSRGFEVLQHRAASSEEPVHFDVVIVGSGYGASAAAHQFSRHLHHRNGERVTVCVLERGKERLPGSFPTGFSELPGELRFSLPGAEPAGTMHGLFDVRLDTTASAVVANGLGGGSLINAGVMLKPRPEVLDGWPSTLGGAAELDPYFEKAQIELGVLTGKHPNTVVSTNRVQVDKYRVLEKLGASLEQPEKGLTTAVPITVTLKKEPGAPVETDVCIDCGDCAQGCNHNAKKSLDTNLLAKAALNGAEIFTEATVQRFDKTNGGWEVYVANTDATRSKRARQPVRIQCTRLIVAAGTYASNELMFRSQAESKNQLYFSDRLGFNYSGNGDNIAALTNCPDRNNMAADESIAPDKRRVGPTITGMIDLRQNINTPIALQELSIPAALKGLLTEVVGFVRMVHALNDQKSANQPFSDELCYVHDHTLSRTAIVIMMGDDGATGRLLYDHKSNSVSLQWPETHSTARNKLYQTQIDTLRNLAEKLGKNVVVHENPARNPLGDALQKTSGATYDAACTLARALGVTLREMSISELSEQVFETIGHDSSVEDLTFENVQA